MVATYPTTQVSTSDVRQASDFLFGNYKKSGAQLADLLTDALHAHPDADPLTLFGDVVQTWVGHDAAALIAAVQRFEAEQFGCEDCHSQPLACRSCREALNYRD